MRTHRGHSSDVRRCICDECQRVFGTVTRPAWVRTDDGQDVPVEEYRRRQDDEQGRGDE